MNCLKSVSTLALISSLAVLGGCATPDTVLPESDRKMIDIYRSAMNEVGPASSGMLDPHAACAKLDLEDESDIDDCVRVIEAEETAAYRQLDAEPIVQPNDYAAYTRTAQNEIDNLFPRLDNPDIVIYVYPHLATRTRAPIPGYTTVIPLYNQVEYRLPGEALLKTPAVPSEPTASAGGTPQ
ncbi:MAG: TIGR03751 family conjugal transfer lipoprotein [Pseudomonadota bacterium]